MATPTTVHNVDGSGYILVSIAADCQMVTRATTISTPTLTPNPTPFPLDLTQKPNNLPGRRRIYVRNNEAVQTPARPTVYIGGPGVTTTNGFPIEPGEQLVLDVTDDIQLYAIVPASDSNTVNLRTAELA